MTSKKLPECWGHRGASVAYPENTLAGFEAAIRSGSEGIESDVHVSLDGVIVMCHDPDLRRTTNMTGLIRERNWYGPDGMEHAQTKKKPEQPLPIFAQLLELLMKEENRHVLFNIDVKMSNDPDILFPSMHKLISSISDWETLLAPRLVLGLWHPRFLQPAMKVLPYCRRSHIGQSPLIAKTYFWDSCETFSMQFEAMTTWQGERFRKMCDISGKKLVVWTVNNPRELMEAARWNVTAIITDVPDTWIKLRSLLDADYRKVDIAHNRIFLWTTVHYWTPYQYMRWREQWGSMLNVGGPVKHDKTASNVNLSETKTQKLIDTKA